MLNRNRLLIPLILLIGGVGIIIKTPSAQTNLPPELNHHEKLKRQNIHLVKKSSPVNRGDFKVEYYMSPYCDGVLTLIALQKNEEGAALLAHFLKRPRHEITFIYKNHLSKSFPAFSYWLTSILPNQPHRQVFALKEFGSCNLIKQIDWTQI